MSFLTSRKCLAPYGIGKSVPRREDARLLTGAGQYADDFNLPGQAYAYLVRSLHPHATIVKTDVAQAVGGPGIIAVLTGSDAAADGPKPIPHSRVPTNPHEVPLRNRDGSGVFIAPHPVLACDAVDRSNRPLRTPRGSGEYRAVAAAAIPSGGIGHQNLRKLQVARPKPAPARAATGSNPRPPEFQAGLSLENAPGSSVGSIVRVPSRDRSNRPLRTPRGSGEYRAVQGSHAHLGVRSGPLDYRRSELGESREGLRPPSGRVEAMVGVGRGRAS
jgi:hypothetical protein